MVSWSMALLFWINTHTDTTECAGQFSISQDVHMNSTLTLTRSFHGKPPGIRAFLISILWNLQKVHHYHMLADWWICVTHYHSKDTAPSAIKFHHVYVCITVRCSERGRRKDAVQNIQWHVLNRNNLPPYVITDFWGPSGWTVMTAYRSAPAQHEHWGVPVQSLERWGCPISECPDARLEEIKKRKRQLDARPFCLSVIQHDTARLRVKRSAATLQFCIR